MYKPKSTTHPKRSFKTPLIVAALLLLLIAAGIYLVRKNDANSTTNQGNTQEQIKLEPATEEEKKESESTKLDKTEPTPPSPNPTPVASQASITSAAQSPDSKEVVVQTRIVGEGWSDCTVTFQQGAATVTKTAGVLYQREFSTCKGFAVPASEFPTAGQWSVLLEVKNTNGTISTDTKTINIIK